MDENLSNFHAVKDQCKDVELEPLTIEGGSAHAEPRMRTFG